MSVNDVVGWLLVGAGIGFAAGFTWRSFIAERERIERDRMRRAAERAMRP